MDKEINNFKNAKWIWPKTIYKEDDYAEFVFDYNAKNKGQYLFNISCDTTYALYLNNRLVKFMGCFDFPNYKYYDEISLNLKQGINHFKIHVWHYGVKTQNYFYSPNSAGLIFSLIHKNKIVLSSSENIKSRVMNEFKNGYKKILSTQQGNSFYFDSTIKANKLSKSVVKNFNYNFIKRKISFLKLLSREDIKITNTDTSVLVDTLKEHAGLIDLEFYSPKEQLISIAYGEHLLNKGHVSRIIGNRDFSFEYYAKKGINKFLHPLKRIGGRYLEFFVSSPIKIKYAGIRETIYPFKIKDINFKDSLVNKIYQTSVYTLLNCTHEHYEDCPWREQAFYTYDSRNQMLCGYYCFEDYLYQRESILLIANSKLYKGLLPICIPSSFDLAIPGYSLFYLNMVNEYIEHSKDLSILPMVKTTIDRFMKVFIKSLDKNNLLPAFDEPFWNFYEWTDGSANENDINKIDKRVFRYDLIINVLLVGALKLYKKLYGVYLYDYTLISKAIKDNFYDKKNGVFVLSSIDKRYSQFSNALCVLEGLGGDDLKEKIINDRNMIEASLAMRPLVYDALLLNTNKYDKYVINDIKNRYKKMLDDGATTFYETEKGAEDFGWAGSLCHGWSAMPIYYFHKLLKK